jgi:isoleucyl-tRNA synthetase
VPSAGDTWTIDAAVTIPANVAVAVSPVYDYVFADLGDEILILEKTLA